LKLKVRGSNPGAGKKVILVLAKFGLKLKISKQGPFLLFCSPDSTPNSKTINSNFHKYYEFLVYLL
jgi:hypothetical protein